MIDIIDKSKCCGCTACMNICPQRAIQMKNDENDIEYPAIDLHKCVNCNLCNSVCTFENPLFYGEPLASFSLRHRQSKVLKESTSGGAFSAIASRVISENGIIACSYMDSNFDIKFKLFDNIDDISIARGSIYAQSSPGSIFQDIQRILLEGKKILFLSTPCQVGGLRSYLGRDFNNLLTVEILCHGVPSNRFLKKHISFLETLYKKKAKSYKFRSKKYSWWPSAIEEIQFEDGSSKSSMLVQAYNFFFHNNLSLRPSCLNCTYRSKKRCADITIGDFWGIDRITHKNENKGASILFPITKKGMKYVKTLYETADLVEYPFADTSYRISTETIKPSYNYEEFWKTYQKNGYKGTVQRYYHSTIQQEIKLIIKKFFLRLRAYR